MIIINADDFGMNESCSRAIALAFSKGLITDTTVMANGAYFESAAALAKERGFFDKIGIHLNLTEGEPLTEEIKKTADFVTDSRFNKKCLLPRELSPDEERAVYSELAAQIEKVKSAGITITHADSHHYIHNAPHLAPIAEKVLRDYGIKKIRLQRNLCNTAEDEQKRISDYNRRLRASGFITADFFGRLSDIENTDIPDNTEILVHPDFDRAGKLIDRAKTEDGFPVGEPIPDLVKTKGAVLGGYGELKG